MGGNDESPSSKHAAGTLGSVNSLLTQALQHGPGLPAAHHADLAGVNVGSNKSHAATIAQSSNTDVSSSDAKAGTNGTTASFEGVGEESGSDGVGFALDAVSVQGSVRRSLVMAQVQLLAEDGLNWGQDCVSRVTMSDCLAFDTILLGGEIEQDFGG